MICRKSTFTIPDANPLLFEHKIWFFVRFWGLEPLFSGFSSTKSRFLCAFGVWNPRFLPFRAQNRGFCALLGSGTLVFGLPENKIEVFVRELHGDVGLDVVIVGFGNVILNVGN